MEKLKMMMWVLVLTAMALMATFSNMKVFMYKLNMSLFFFTVIATFNCLSLVKASWYLGMVIWFVLLGGLVLMYFFFFNLPAMNKLKKSNITALYTLIKLCAFFFLLFLIYTSLMDYYPFLTMSGQEQTSELSFREASSNLYSYPQKFNLGATLLLLAWTFYILHLTGFKY